MYWNYTFDATGMAEPIEVRFAVGGNTLLDAASEQLAGFVVARDSPCILTMYRDGELRMWASVEADRKVLYRTHYLGDEQLHTLIGDEEDGTFDTMQAALHAAVDLLRDNV